ncbi:hypothetical protein [Desulfobotulus sp.]|uniref:hypothetical protein n=1 Tax=Desulfobotulus sp. TaxID=1940337 RepID=UPI002A35EA77|nr:hypothetical protein [Desulfobotulus sp.]MDY0164513.1 hypothetical protein [Desulfobotulus sp.]
MKIIVTTPVFDIDGTRVMEQDSPELLANRSGSRRVSRTATLDGGAHVNDMGYASADRTIKVSTETRHLEWLSRVAKMYGEIRVSTEEGLFFGVPSSWGIRNNTATLSVLVLREVRCQINFGQQRQ